MDTPKVFFPGRRTLPKAASFWLLAVLFLMLFFASAAASPLYPVYQVQFDFSAATLTAVFAVYVLVLLVTLLFFGTVSDYLGRLPVILTALVFSVAGCAVFQRRIPVVQVPPEVLEHDQRHAALTAAAGVTIGVGNAVGGTDRLVDKLRISLSHG